MGDLLTPLHTKAISKSDQAENQLRPISRTQAKHEKQSLSLDSPEDVFEALRLRPDPPTLSRALRWLESAAAQDDGFNIKKPGPKAAQIIFVLVNEIVPDYWYVPSERGESGRAKEKPPLKQCLSSVAGVGAIASRLKLLVGSLKESRNRAAVSSVNRTQPVETILDVTENVLAKDDFITTVWSDVCSFNLQSTQRFLQWRELVSLLASGKLLSIASEASHTLNDLSASVKAGSWVGDGSQYAAWLGRNFQHMVRILEGNDMEGRKAVSQMFSKALTLGYTDQLVRSAFSDLINGENQLVKKSQKLLGILSAHERQMILFTVIRITAEQHLASTGSPGDKPNASPGQYSVGGVAALIATLVKENPSLQESLVGWLTAVSADAISQSHNTHRAVIAALSVNKERTTEAFQKSLDLFGDKLYIKHTPTLHQEVNTQVLLILAGYIYRDSQAQLAEISRSSVYLNAISNRLATSSLRARFLGMVVGTAISELVDAKDRRMMFSAEDMNSTDGQWYRRLTDVNDAVGVIGDLKPAKAASTNSSSRLSRRPVNSNAKSTKPPVKAQLTSKIISIEEIDDDDDDESESEAEDLPLYEKPDSDPEDEDEDATLVRRNRPTAPVYIRDLISGLRDAEDFDRHKLALAAAASLIRRKAAFGTEVSENIEQLATVLVGLGDKWEMTDFQKMRLQGMIAVLTAEPLKMGQWFSKTFYSGDYSMGQRASILTTLGLGARELAGLGKDDAALTGANATSDDQFPSKTLPAKLHQIYALEAAPMDALSSQLERTMIQPMAAEAADKLSGPNALKIRTFSSRMAFEKRRPKPIPNALAKIVAEGFFFPLTGRWRIHLQAYGENSSHTSPFLLTHLLKTLSLILHASGSSTLSLPQMTAEFWDLLLSLRPRATDPSVLEALLFAFLTLLDINENDQRRLAEEHAKELLETQQWVEAVFERIGGGSEEGERVRMLAAGVLVRTRQVVEKYQRMLMGDLVDFM